MNPAPSIYWALRYKTIAHLCNLYVSNKNTYRRELKNCLTEIQFTYNTALFLSVKIFFTNENDQKSLETANYKIYHYDHII